MQNWSSWSGVVLTTLSVMVLVLGSPAAATDSSKHKIVLEAEGGSLASGKLDFKSRGGKSKVKVTVKRGTPNAPTTLLVDGVPHGTVTASGGGSARFKFQAPAKGTTPLLDFDPRGGLVEITDELGVIADSTTTGGGQTPGSRVDERVDLAATGVIPGAGGRARLRLSKGVRDFDVEIEDVPDGSYTLLIDGSAVGAILVSLGGGEIEFSDGGDDPDELPLTFEPLGALVQVAQGSSVILSATFLADAPGVSSCTESQSTTILSNVGPDPDAKGEARLRTRDDCDRDLRVEIEDVPVGTYELWIGGVLEGTIDVVLVLGEEEGKIEFDTDPDEPGELPFDFDPVGQTIQIRQGTTVFLSSTVGGGTPGTCELIDEEPDMTNTGVDPNAKGKARLRQEADCDRDLRVQIEDLALGDYDLLVGGIVRGTITVTLVLGEAVGEIEFDDDPDEPGELLLDFDPRGETAEVRQGGLTYLTVDLPS